MAVVIIPYGNQGKYTKIRRAVFDISTPESFIEDMIQICGGREYFILEDVDDWDGNLDDLRKGADEIAVIDEDGTKHEFRRKTLLDKIKKYNPFRKK